MVYACAIWFEVISAFGIYVARCVSCRCVSAEGAFLEAWKSVGSMADPVSTLEAAAEKAAKVNSKLTDSDLVIAQLRETVSLYEEEIVVGKKRDKELQKLKTKLEAYDR